MRGPCQQSFRWDDDEDYQQTQDANGRFISDANSKRPGIYTYLAGFPNFWNRQKVDHNLKTEEDPSLVAGPFDRRSVMLYRFPEIFYKSTPSPCAPLGNGQSLSDGDQRGLQLLYPQTAAEAGGAGGNTAQYPCPAWRRQKELNLRLMLRRATRSSGGGCLNTQGKSEID